MGPEAIGRLLGKETPNWEPHIHNLFIMLFRVKASISRKKLELKKMIQFKEGQKCMWLTKLFVLCWDGNRQYTARKCNLSLSLMIFTDFHSAIPLESVRCTKLLTNNSSICFLLDISIAPTLIAHHYNVFQTNEMVDSSTVDGYSKTATETGKHIVC